MHAMMCAPPEPSSNLLWWQWVERCRGIETHEPPKLKPYFLKLRKDADYKRELFSCWDVNSLCAR